MLEGTKIFGRIVRVFLGYNPDYDFRAQLWNLCHVGKPTHSIKGQRYTPFQFLHHKMNYF